MVEAIRQIPEPTQNQRCGNRECHSALIRCHNRLGKSRSSGGEGCRCWHPGANLSGLEIQGRPLVRHLGLEKGGENLVDMMVVCIHNSVCIPSAVKRSSSLCRARLSRM